MRSIVQFIIQKGQWPTRGAPSGTLVATPPLPPFAWRGHWGLKSRTEPIHALLERLSLRHPPKSGRQADVKLCSLVMVPSSWIVNLVSDSLLQKVPWKNPVNITVKWCDHVTWCPLASWKPFSNYVFAYNFAFQCTHFMYEWERTLIYLHGGAATVFAWMGIVLPRVLSWHFLEHGTVFQPHLVKTPTLKPPIKGFNSERCVVTSPPVIISQKSYVTDCGLPGHSVKDCRKPKN